MAAYAFGSLAAREKEQVFVRNGDVASALRNTKEKKDLSLKMSSEASTLEHLVFPENASLNGGAPASLHKNGSN